MDLKIYQSKVRYRNRGMISGSFEEEMEITDKRFPSEIELVKAFLADDDITEITITSSCIGFVKTFTKLFRK